MRRSLQAPGRVSFNLISVVLEYAGGNRAEGGGLIRALGHNENLLLEGKAHTKDEAEQLAVKLRTLKEPPGAARGHCRTDAPHQVSSSHTLSMALGRLIFAD